MAVQTVEDLLKTHRELLDRNRKRVEAVSSGGRLPPEEIRAHNEEEIAELTQRLERTTASRDQVVARYDAEIQRLEDAIGRLKEDRKRIDEILGGSGGVRPPRKAAAAGRKAPAKGPAKPRPKKARKR